LTSARSLVDAARRELPVGVKSRLKRWRRRLLRPRPTGAVRLNLGCGQDYQPGYVNVDVDPSADSDMVLDTAKVRRHFRDAAVAEVRRIPTREYHPLWEARDILRDVHALLQPGGRLVLELCDIAKCARKLLESEDDLPTYLEALRAFYGFDLEMIARRRRYRPASFAWSAWHIRLELERTGFRQVTISEPQTHARRVWRDMRIEAVK
jgi:hypothetical protein